MEKIAKITIAIIIIIVIVLSALIVQNLTISGKITDKADQYTYTKAICNSTSCQDHIITCTDKERLSITPTGAVIDFGDDWEDPRSTEQINKEC